MHTDGGDLALTHPDARQLRDAAGPDVEIRQRIDQRLLDRPHIRAHVAFPFAQIHDGIAHDLPRPVIGDIAAAVRGMEGDAGAGQQFFAGQNVLQVAIAAHRDGVGMFQQDELIGDGAHFPLLHQPLLPCEGSTILHRSGFLPLAPKH